MDKQPPTLLDQRDAVLRDMAKLAKLGVTELQNGQVIVNFGGSGRGFELVTPTESRDVRVYSSQEAAGSDLRLVLDPMVSTDLPASPSGAIGGAVALNTEILRPVRVGLDHLARTFAAEANQIHRRGLDAKGEFGEICSKQLHRSRVQQYGCGSDYCQCQGIDLGSAPTEALELIYRQSTDTWSVLDLQTRERLGEIKPGENQRLQGMSFSITGAPENGDVVIFLPLTARQELSRSWSQT